MNSELKLDFTRRITQSNSSEIIAILYEIFVYLEDGREAMRTECRQGVNPACKQVVQHLKDADQKDCRHSYISIFLPKQ